ncbi:hypothetical protein CTAYLR_007102 [Chrysophaeum taylorii]|uniref:Ion transport domain-containing protein n=1 Tax=Chrysophaeum taylorii TaxID=2483200 RepID=A0AAD7UKD7_9STRA|nr:hypothetical protein CTAYLR_007102 [Chrysophaeum taylorii]
MKPVRKKVRLKRDRRKKIVVPVEDDVTRERRERQDLVERLVKVGTSWRYVAKNAAKIEEEEEVPETLDDAPSPQEPVVEDVEPMFPPGTVLVEARDHPELRVYIRMAKAGIDASQVAKLMATEQLDASVLDHPKKIVMLEERYHKSKPKKEEFEIERETPQDLEAAKEKVSHITCRKPPAKVDPSISLQQRQLDLLRMADSVFKYRERFSAFVWRSRLGDADVGFTIDLDDLSLTKGVSAILDSIEASQPETIIADLATEEEEEEEEEEEPPWSEGDAPAAADDDVVSPKSKQQKQQQSSPDFKHGSQVYKLERTIHFLQMLGLVASMDVDWPPGFKFLVDWTTRVLDGHLYPLTYVQKHLHRRRRHRDDKAEGLRNGPWTLVERASQWMPRSAVDLYFYRDVVNYASSIALSAVLLASLFRLWEIDDYTDPKITDRWMLLYVERWFRLGIPRSFAYALVASLVVVGVPAGIAFLTYGSQGHFEHANAMLMVGGTFALYVWIIFVVLASAWRAHFRAKVTHNRSYAAIVLLKETVSAKSTLCFVLLFLTYLPTCLYVAGGMRPVYSAKVWTRHSGETMHEPLENTYRHIACYYVSFPPRIRPKSSRARRGRVAPPGFVSYPPHPFHAHEATRRLDCDTSAGILVFTVSVATFFLYGAGLPVTVLHLTYTATKQLHSCEWWQNYQTAWRRFTYVLAECEAYSLEHVLITTARLWKHDAQKEAKVTLELVVATARRVLKFVVSAICTSCHLARLVASLCGGKAKIKKKKKKQPRTHTSPPKAMNLEETGRHESSGTFSLLTSRRFFGFVGTALVAFCGCFFPKNARRWRKELQSGSVGKKRKRKRLFKVSDHREFNAPKRGLRARLYRICQSKLFNTAITVAVLLSLSPLVLQAELEELMGETTLNLLVTWALGLLFVAEFLVKIIAFTPRYYFRSRFNNLDFVLILLWLLDVLVGSGTNVSFLRSLRALKSVRMLRMARMARTLRVLKLGSNLDPVFRAIRAWVLRWVADTPLSTALLEQMERGARAGLWRISKSLPAKIEKMKHSYLHAKNEYAISFDEFTRDHELLIENIDAVVDTSALGYLIRPFKSNASFWRVVLLGENLVFCAVITFLRASQHPWAQCLGAALVCIGFGIATTLKRPYMYLHERQLDELTRTTIIILFLVGGVLDLISRDESYARSMLDVFASTFVLYTAVRLLYLLRVHDAVRDACSFTIRELDSLVLSLVAESLDVKSYVLEDSNLGLRLLQQWDELLAKQWSTGFIAWPSPKPRKLITFWQKLFLVKWAAARSMNLATFRTPTGQCILHSAMLKAEPEAVAWILYHHPKLLDAIDDQRDSPVIIALKELAKTLLDHVRMPTQQTEWKRSKLAEILLSDQIQHYRVPWSLPHFRALGDIAVPLYGELVQQLALALNLRPPPGFVRVSKWLHYPGDIPDFLAQCFLACRDRVELPRCELGDVGSRTIQALLGALEMAQTSITRESNFFTFYPIHIVRFVAPHNRLRDDAGLAVARALDGNTSVVYLDLRYNHLGDDAGVALAEALGQNATLTTCSLAHNRLQAESGEAFARLLKENKKQGSLRSLSLANNRLGPRIFWRNRLARACVASSGPALCAALRHNQRLTHFDVSNNNLGAEAAIELDKSFRRHLFSPLVSLGFSGNNLAGEGGKALAHALTSRVCLTQLDAARNNFGSAVGLPFAAAIKKNSQLVALDLSQNCLGTKVGRAIALALHENQTLTSIEAADNGFGPDAFRAFASLLGKGKTLAYVGLSANRFGAQSFEGGETAGVGAALGEALEVNHTLTGLDLRGAHVSCEELLAILTGFANNRSLVHVALDGQEFDNACVLQLTNSLDRQRRRTRTASARPPSRGTAAAALMNFGGLAESRVFSGLCSVGLNNCKFGARAGPVAVSALMSLMNLTELHLAGNAMGSKLGEHVGDFLSSQQGACRITKLDLSANSIGETGGLPLARAMEVNTSLTDIDLSDNGLTPAVGTALADALCELVESGFVARPAHCVRLALAKNEIGTDAARDIFFALRSPVTQEINLSHNDIGPDAGESVSECLRRNTIQWRSLNLASNKLCKDGVNPIFWALRRNSSLAYLSLADNNVGPDFGTERDEIGDYGNSCAAAIEHNYALVSLDLAENGISFECGIGVTQALKENPALTELNFEGNHLDHQSGIAIADKLEDDGNLRSLILSRNDIGWEGGLAIATKLEANKALLYLDLSFNSLGTNGPTAGVALADMICKNAYLRHLDCEGNLLGPEAGMAIAQALAKNNTLLTLNARDNHFDSDVGTAFLSHLADNAALVDLQLSIEEVSTDVCLDIAALCKARATTSSMGRLDMEQRMVNQARRRSRRPKGPRRSKA